MRMRWGPWLAGALVLAVVATLVAMATPALAAEKGSPPGVTVTGTETTTACVPGNAFIGIGAQRQWGQQTRAVAIATIDQLVYLSMATADTAADTSMAMTDTLTTCGGPMTSFSAQKAEQQKLVGTVPVGPASG